MTTAPTSTGSGPGVARATPRWLLAVAIVLAALNLRTAVTSVGPLLDELERGVGLSAALAGVLTTLPVLSFAALGWLTPGFAARVGERAALAAALAMMTAGLLLRALVSSAVPFLLFSVLALAGGAMGNVLLPVLVKHHFPDRLGELTATYTTAMAVGTTLAAAGTVPLAGLRGGIDWRLGLGCWAVLSAVATVVWVVLPAGGMGGGAETRIRSGTPMLRSRTAWALALFFGAQSMQAYIAFGWFAQFFRERAQVSSATAGLYVAFLAALSVPLSMAVPALAARRPSQRALVVVFATSYLLGYLGMLTAPRAGAWLWMLLVGVGGGAFPLALTLIGLRTRTTANTAALSAVTQSVGYLVAGCGPLLVGVLHGRTGGWSWPFALLFADLALLAVSGWAAARPRFADDDIDGRVDGRSGGSGRPG